MSTSTASTCASSTCASSPSCCATAALVGRLDGRFAGWDRRRRPEHFERDPSYSAIHGPYSAALNHYVRTELGYASTCRTRSSPTRCTRGRTRSSRAAPSRSPASCRRPCAPTRTCGARGLRLPRRRHARTTAAEHMLAHLRVPAELRANIEVCYYEAGHMMYVHEPSRLQQSKDLAAFITR